MLREEIGPVGHNFDVVAFPDEGAAKRFAALMPGFPVIFCGKVRQGTERIVRIQEGNCAGLRVIIIDDMVVGCKRVGFFCLFLIGLAAF